MKELKIKSFAKAHRRLLITLAVVVIFLVLAGAYIALSMNAWRTYGESATALRSKTKELLDNSLQQSSENAQGRAKKLKSLKDVQDKLRTAEQMCTMQPVFEWQSGSFEGARRQKEHCHSTRDSLTTLGESLGKTLRYLEDEKKLTDILAPLRTEGELAEDTWKQHADQWAEASRKASGVTPSIEFRSAYDIVNKRVSAVAAKWQELIAVHEAKDRAKFEKTTDELKQAYGSLKAIPDDTAPILSVLESQLTSSYKIAFH